MKKLTSISHLPLLVLAAGLVGAFARAMLYLLGRDASGLLVQNHPLQFCCWILAGAVALCLWLVLKNQTACNNYHANFQKNTRVLPAAIANAAGILVTVLLNLDLRDNLTLAWAVLGLLSAWALVTIGKGRKAGKRPKFYLYGLVCLFYALHMIFCYKLWSGKPQVADYCFAVLACACLTLSAYQRTAFCAEAGNRRAHLFFCLMAGFFCILCIPGSEHPLLYLTSGCFFLTDLAMTPHHPQEKETP